MAEGANDETAAAVVHKVTEPRRVPALGLFLGYGAMLPLAVAAILVWMVDGALADAILALSIVWGAAILAFLSGVRRGVSFRTEYGPATSQIALMALLFVLALAALTVPWALAKLGALLAGYATLMIADRPAALAGKQPLYFARLRPPQMAVAVLSLAALLIHQILPGW